MSLSENYNYSCPYCWSINSIEIDLTADNFQELVTDCEVCCKPIEVKIQLRNGSVLSVDALMA